MVDKPTDRREEQKTQSTQPILLHLFAESNLADHPDQRKGQVAEPAKGFSHVKIATDHFTKGVLILEFFNMLFNTAAFIIALKN